MPAGASSKVRLWHRIRKFYSINAPSWNRPRRKSEVMGRPRILKRSESSFRPTEQNTCRLLLLGLYFAFFTLHLLVAALANDFPIVYADEVGYLQKARLLAQLHAPSEAGNVFFPGY